jgi:hypothetical protein
MRRHGIEMGTKRTLEKATRYTLRPAGLAQRPIAFSFTQRFATHLYVTS